jgi:hypothetical protein
MCVHLAATYTEKNFFFAFLDHDGTVFSSTGSEFAPYNPAFHLFDRFCKGITVKGKDPFFDMNAAKQFSLYKNAWKPIEEAGGQVAHQVLAQINKDIHKAATRII